MENNRKTGAQIIEFHAKKKETPRLMSDLALASLEALTEYVSNECGFTQNSIRNITCKHFGIRDYTAINSQKLYDQVVQSLLRVSYVRREARTIIRSAQRVK